MRIVCRIAALAAATLFLAVPARETTAQEADLAALVEEARAASPEIAAADRALDAARARAEAAGAFPDPRLAVGLTNAVVSDPLASEDMMTMRMVQLGTTLPYPGKLDLEEEAARWMVSAAEAERQAVELGVVAEVKRAYYEIWFLDRALDVVRANRELLSDFVSVTGTRYSVGTGGQPDILKAQVERTRLGDELLDLERRRVAAVAEINARLDRPSRTPVSRPSIPEEVERAAVPPPGSEVRFTAIAPVEREATEAGGPLPDLASLQRATEESNPRLRALAARVEARRAEARLADLAAFPDFDLTLGYGQRSGREDMASAMVSMPLPLFKGRKQDPLADAADGEVAALEAERAVLANEVRSDVARLHAALLRTRDRVALMRDGVLPQARAALESALAGYRVASVDFLTLVDSQATLFRHELDYHDLLAGFARDLAALEQTVGAEVLR
ncbi:MAG TPA: TolC family protein [Gemmatimonadota bacterium]|nr:TolC family protein [Gemmatimonadota bacterium]